jgi:hypothetical protein
MFSLPTEGAIGLAASALAEEAAKNLNFFSIFEK